ncbi:MAG: precorrin-6A/cobalt-precorrin-6A reductase [Pseudomonadota bacterium]
MLGGTREARAVSTAFADHDQLHMTHALAGATATPHLTDGIDTRIGGFGGADGLAEYLRETEIDLLIDATHPFAVTISRNASAAADNAGCPLLRVARPPWMAIDGDDWRHVRAVEDIVSELRGNAHVFMAIGSGGMEAAINLAKLRPDCGLLLRIADFSSATAAQGLPNNLKVLVARPPYDLAQERALFEYNSITDVVTKNSGGDGASAKLIAARERGNRVWMIARPQAPGLPMNATEVEGAAEAIAFLQRWAVSSIHS